MAVPEITVTEWLNELTALSKRNNASGFTTEEVAESMGRGTSWARQQLKKAFRAGLVEMAGTREAMRMDGKPCQIPVYRVTPQWKKNGGKK
jgi:predicted transcriptional regulator